MSPPDLYILRHGETVWNVQRKFQGRKDSALTPKGEAQARHQGRLLRSIKNPPSMIFCSPQGRAVQTAQIALGSLDALVIDDRLHEIDFGEWEGATQEEIKSQIDGRYEDGAWNFESPNGETFEMIWNRMLGFVEDLNESAIIVTHGTASMVLRGVALGLNQREILTLSRDQSCLYCIQSGAETILR